MNIESVTIDCDWDGIIAKNRVRHNMQIFNKAFSGENPNYEYIDAANVKSGIQKCFRKKSVEELLADIGYFIVNNYFHN